VNIAGNFFVKSVNHSLVKNVTNKERKMVLNNTQQQIMKTIMNQHFIEDDDYLELPASTALLVLRSIIDDEVYRQNYHVLEETKQLPSIHQIRKMLNHEAPQNVMETKYYAEEGFVTYLNYEGTRVTEKQGLLGLSSRNDHSALPVTKQDVVNFIVEFIENEIAVQERILKHSNIDEISSTSTMEVNHPVYENGTENEELEVQHENEEEEEQVEHTMETIPLHFSNTKTQQYYTEAKAYIESLDMHVKPFTTKITPDILKDIYAHLLKSEQTKSVHHDDIITMKLLLSEHSYLGKEFSSNLRKQCIDELETSGVQYRNSEVCHKNILALLKFSYATNECQDNAEKAIEILTESIALCPNYTSAYVLRGQYYALNNKLEEAIQDMTSAIELNGEDYAYYYYRAKYYWNLDQIDKAMADCDTALEMEPNSTNAHELRGVVYMEGFNLPEKACVDLDKAIRLSVKNQVDNYSIFLYYGKCLSLLYEYELAVQAFTKASESQPSNAIPYKLRSYCYEDLKMYDEAWRDAIRSHELDPSGITLERLHRIIKHGNLIEQSYRQLVETNILMSQIQYNGSGTSLYTVLSNAIKNSILYKYNAFNPPSTLHPETQILWSLAMAYVVESPIPNDYDLEKITLDYNPYALRRIVSDLDRVVTTTKDNLLTILSIVVMSCIHESISTERTHLKKLLIADELMNDTSIPFRCRASIHAYILFRIAGIYYSLDDAEHAHEYNNRAYSVLWTYSRPNILLAEMVLDKGHTESAKDLLLAVKDYFPRLPKCYYLLGQISFDEEKEEEGLEYLKQCIEMDPDCRDWATKRAKQVQLEKAAIRTMANGKCSFSVTGSSYSVVHKWYNCRTCGLVGNLGCCEACVNICHKDHDVSEATTSEFFCDW
jgi:tetratricopeptide (TPR) repeat protein